MRNVRKLGVVLAAVVIVTLGFVAWRMANGGAASRALASSEHVRASGPEQDATLRGTTDVVPSAESDRATAAIDDVESAKATSRTLRAYLEEFWGSEWPEMERRLQEWCAITGQSDCLEQFVATTPLPWEEVATVIHDEFVGGERQTEAMTRGAIGWPEEAITADEVRRRYAVSKDRALREADLLAIERIAANHETRIRLETDAWMRDLGAALQSVWNSGEFERGPLIMPGYSGADAVHTVSINKDGWVVTAVLKHERFPWLAEQLHELAVLRQARDDEIRDYLKTLQ